MKHLHSIAKLALLLATGLVPGACMDMAGDDAEQAGKLAETTQADGAENGEDSPSPPSPAEVRAWMESNFPRWRVFFAGDPYVWRQGDPKRVWLEPVVVDAECPLILVPQDRDGHDLGSGEWIRLRTRALRDKGMTYFVKEVVDKYSLSLMDLVVIHHLLGQGIDSIPVVPASMPSDASDDDTTQFLYEEGPPSGIPGDWGPDNHTVGPGNIGGGGSRPPPPRWVPPRPPPPRGHGSAPRPHPWPPKPRPPKPAKRSPNGDPGGYSMRDIRNGLNPDDSPEAYYPGFDDPKRNPQDREIFRCQGHVYIGYRNMCPDYSFFPPDRWNKVIEAFLKMRTDADRNKLLEEMGLSSIPPWKLHAFWHDGKKPECLQDAKEMARCSCTALGETCVAALWLLGGAPGAALGALEGMWAYDHCKDWIEGYAVRNICTK